MRIGKYNSLIRYRVSAFAALSALTGYVSGGGIMDRKALITAMGVFLLASGASALNQVSEMDTDALMSRTMNRPLPSGSMTIEQAAAVSAVLALAGLWALLFVSPLSAILGLVSLVIYNVIYTPLKRKTGMAIIIGAVAGAMPPAIGWAAGGAEMRSPLLPALCLLFYLWQMPHYWMILSRHRDDYVRAGLPVWGEGLTGAQASRIFLTWTAATSALGLMLPLMGSGGDGTGIILLLLGSALFLVSGLAGMSSGAQRASFAGSNIYILMVMFSVLAG